MPKKEKPIINAAVPNLPLSRPNNACRVIYSWLFEAVGALVVLAGMAWAIAHFTFFGVLVVYNLVFN